MKAILVTLLLSLAVLTGVILHQRQTIEHQRQVIRAMSGINFS